MPKTARTPAQTAISRHVGRAIRHHRTTRGWSLRALAQRTTAAGYPINPAAIQTIETGHHGPDHGLRAVTVDELLTLAAALGVHPAHLLPDLGTPPTADEEPQP
ncbi:helix-turn-helix transcriptional regulator [Streptomyces syringium]|uniref:helix-turn-helix domain-containing protein n=1 Tax=Streptomyces syringium TaxID=76729 RepID=UPI00343AAD51